MKSHARLRLRRPEAAEPSMPFVNGRRFYCLCGVGVFTRRGPKFACNGCLTTYVGEE